MLKPDHAAYCGETGAHLMTLVRDEIPPSVQQLALDALDVHGWGGNGRHETYGHYGGAHAPTLEPLPEQLVPWVNAITGVYAAHAPAAFMRQLDAADGSTQLLQADGPPLFSTMTVNWNRTLPMHIDQGIHDAGMVVFGCLRAGEYTGGFYEMTDFGLAADLQAGDVLLATPGYNHRNTPIVGVAGEFMRITTALYLRRAVVD